MLITLHARARPSSPELEFELHNRDQARARPELENVMPVSPLLPNYVISFSVYLQDINS